jgi:hypothetical protein
MKNHFILENLLIGIAFFIGQGLPHDLVAELRIVFTKAFEEKRISHAILERFE